MSLMGLAANLAVTAVVSRVAPGLGGSVVAGFAGGATESLVEGDTNVGDVMKSGGYGAAGSLIGDGVGRGLGVAARYGARGAESALGKATALSTDASTAAGEWKTADDALEAARNKLANTNRLNLPGRQSAQKAVQTAEKDAAAAQKKWEDAQIKADNPGFSISKMQQRKKILDRAGKELRGGKGRAKQPGFRQAGWGNTGLRSLGATIGSNTAGGRSGGSSSSDSGGEDKTPKPKPTAQNVELMWGGKQYMDSPPKEPIVQDPSYQVAIESPTGFLLYPKGLNDQIRRWYVG
ncbi:MULTISPECIES: hypothetical protein [Nocardia]|nr:MULTISPECIES: hypothetical protein [Nocardia]